MSGLQTGTLIPTHPSNRRVFEKMINWGWEPTKQNGHWQEMESPPINGKVVTISIRPPTQHDANPTSVFREIYRLTTQGNAELFWAGPGDPEAWADMVKQARLREKKRRNEAADLKLSKAAERNKRLRDAEEATKPKPKKEEAAMAALPAIVGGAQIRSQQVYEVLVNHDRPLTVKAIARELGVPETSRTIREISNRCGYLASRGLAVRMMEGTYRAAQGSLAIAARVQHDVNTTTPPDPHPRAATTAVEHPSPPPSPVPEPATAQAPKAESVDDAIEAVLDLLLPGGFRAVDLKVIEAWVGATREMVEKVTQR